MNYLFYHNDLRACDMSNTEWNTIGDRQYPCFMTNTSTFYFRNGSTDAGFHDVYKVHL